MNTAFLVPANVNLSCQQERNDPFCNTMSQTSTYMPLSASGLSVLEKYKYPYLSIDHLKMGLIRSGHTELTPLSADADLTAYLWPIVREIIKTAIENGQNLTVEQAAYQFLLACGIAPSVICKLRRQLFLTGIVLYCFIRKAVQIIPKIDIVVP